MAVASRQIEKANMCTVRNVQTKTHSGQWMWSIVVGLKLDGVTIYYDASRRSWNWNHFSRACSGSKRKTTFLFATVCEGRDLFPEQVPTWKESLSKFLNRSWMSSWTVSVDGKHFWTRPSHHQRLVHHTVTAPRKANAVKNKSTPTKVSVAGKQVLKLGTQAGMGFAASSGINTWRKTKTSFPGLQGTAMRPWPWWKRNLSQWYRRPALRQWLGWDLYDSADQTLRWHMVT